MAGDVRRIAPEERTEGVPTPGMIREEAVATDRMWAGLARTEVGMASGWHHHGGYESTIYVLSGALRMEFGPGGTEVLEAGPGDFLYVAPGAVHGGQPERRGVADRGGPVGVGRAGHQRGRAGVASRRARSGTLVRGRVEGKGTACGVHCGENASARYAASTGWRVTSTPRARSCRTSLLACRCWSWRWRK